MSDQQTPMSRLSVDPFSELVGQEIVEFVFQLAPTEVGTRVGKALDHYTKALRLVGVDDEMGALRCIAAEEELVVAIFEWLKLDADKIPEHRDFIGRERIISSNSLSILCCRNCGSPSAVCWKTGSPCRAWKATCTGV